MLDIFTFTYTLTISVFLKLLCKREDILEIEKPEDKILVAERLYSFSILYSILGRFESWMNIWVLLILTIPLIFISLAFVVYIVTVIDSPTES